MGPRSAEQTVRRGSVPEENISWHCHCRYTTIDVFTIVVGHLKGTATVYKHRVPRQCLSSQGTNMYSRVHEGWFLNDFHMRGGVEGWRGRGEGEG